MTRLCRSWAILFVDVSSAFTHASRCSLPPFCPPPGPGGSGSALCRAGLSAGCGRSSSPRSRRSWFAPF
eukprot:8602498-Prorocentrum_lima.AAC.1